jgi:membrane associated rhomboid family serine protease
MTSQREPYAHKAEGGPDPFARAQEDARRRLPPGGGPIFNSVPPVILVLCALILGLQALDSLSLASDGRFHSWLWSLGALTTGDAADLAGGQSASALVLHVFVHGGWVHAGMNTAALLAFGAAAARPFGPHAAGVSGFLAFFFLCALAGSMMHLFTQGLGSTVMVGASTAVSGVLAAAGWARGGRVGMAQLAVPWALINIALAVTGVFAPLPVAWGGHLGGLLAGVVLYPLFVAAFGRRRRR